MNKSLLEELNLTIPPFIKPDYSQVIDRSPLPPSTIYLRTTIHSPQSTFSWIKSLPLFQKLQDNSSSLSLTCSSSIPSYLFTPGINFPTFDINKNLCPKKPKSTKKKQARNDPIDTLVKKESDLASNAYEIYAKIEAPSIFKENEHDMNCKLEEANSMKEEYIESKPVKLECKIEAIKYEEEETNLETNQETQEKETESDEEYVADGPKKGLKKKKGVRKQKAQNRIKNLPGLIMQRVKTNVKNYLTHHHKVTPIENRLLFIHKILGCFHKSDKERFMDYLDEYQKHWKTWKTIIGFLELNPKYGKVVLELVAEFLGPDGDEDFNQWLRNGKMCNKSIVTIQDAKKLLASKFDAIKLEVEEEGDFVHKIIKKEEA